MKNQSLILVPQLLTVLFSAAVSAHAGQGKNESNVLKYYDRVEARVDNESDAIGNHELVEQTENQVHSEPRQFSASVNTTSSSLGKRVVATTRTQTQAYVVKSGDTLSKIAKRNGTTVSALQKLNRLSDASVLKIGQKLVVSSKTVSAPVMTQPARERAESNAGTRLNYVKHVVKSGETISKLARRYEVTSDAILTVNRLPDGARLLVGQSLTIPLQGSQAPVSNRPTDTRENMPVSVSRQSYEIKGKDTFYSLAIHYGTTVKELQAANPGVDPSKLRPGMTIKIPVKGNRAKPIVVNPEVEVEQNTPYEESQTAQELHPRNIKPATNNAPRKFEPTAINADNNVISRNVVDPYIDYAVEPRDTWDSIGAQFHTSGAELKKINNARGSEEPMTGISIQVPRAGRLGIAPTTQPKGGSFEA